MKGTLGVVPISNLQGPSKAPKLLARLTAALLLFPCASWSVRASSEADDAQMAQADTAQAAAYLAGRQAELPGDYAAGSARRTRRHRRVLSPEDRAAVRKVLQIGARRRAEDDGLRLSLATELRRMKTLATRVALQQDPERRGEALSFVEAERDQIHMLLDELGAALPQRKPRAESRLARLRAEVDDVLAIVREIAASDDSEERSAWAQELYRKLEDPRARFERQVPAQTIDRFPPRQSASSHRPIVELPLGDAAVDAPNASFPLPEDESLTCDESRQEPGWGGRPVWRSENSVELPGPRHESQREAPEAPDAYIPSDKRDGK